MIWSSKAASHHSSWPLYIGTFCTITTDWKDHQHAVPSLLHHVLPENNDLPADEVPGYIIDEFLTFMANVLVEKKLMLTGRMWNVPRQVRAARSELVNIGMVMNTGGQMVTVPLHMLWASCTRCADEAHPYGTHVEHSGGRCMGHGKDDKGIQGAGYGIIIWTIV